MKNIALNMIVGPGDAALLKRCLEAFNVQKLFDEIVIVLTSGDVACSDVAHEFTDQVYAFNWSSKRFPFGNFAGARNLALQNTVSDYVMWLDCDDLPGKDFVEFFANIRKTPEDYDYFTFDYVVGENCVMKRERVWRRSPDLFWQLPVHEHLTIDNRIHSTAHIKNLQVIHAPAKSGEASVGRNLQILKHEYNRVPSFAVSFYYAKELLNTGNLEGIEILSKLLDTPEIPSDVAAQICVTLCSYHKMQGAIDKMETLSRIGLSYNETYADFYVNLGEIYESRKDTSRAIEFYELALKCKFNGGGIYYPALYTSNPALHLVELFDEKGELEWALLYSKLVLKAFTAKEDVEKILEVRKDIINRILKGEENGTR